MFDLKPKLTQQQLEAIDLLVTKNYDARMTMQKIAEKVGVSRKTLFNWRKIPEFNDEYLKVAMEVNRSSMPIALAWMSRTIESPKAKDSTKLKIAELLMKQQGELKDVQESTVSVDADIDSIIADFKSLGADLTE